MALAGNKSDIDPTQKKISIQQAKDIAKKNDMIFSETSAKTGDGVQQLFRKVAEDIAKIKKK